MTCADVPGSARVSPFSRAAVSVLVLATLCFPRAALATQVVPLTLEQMVRGSSDIVVASVLSAESRWGDASKRWMLTDYTIEVEQVVLGNVLAGGRVKVTFWGGTIGGEIQRIAGMQLPAVGERHVLMLEPGWAKANGSPIVGLDQGLFRIRRDSASGREIVRDRANRPVYRTASGGLTIAATPETAAEPIGLAEFVAWIAAVPRGTDPVAAPATSAAGDRRIIQTLTLQPELPGDQIAAGGRSRRPARAANESLAPPPAEGERTGAVLGDPTVSTTERLGAQYTWSAPAWAPIVVNQFPASFSPWSPEDQYQMSKWNHYAADVFRVLVSPTGTYGWPNDRFDLAGWPSSADTQRVYGYTWGATTLGITFTRTTDHIIEADIALNPAYSWTLDDQWVYDGGSIIGFRQTMIHELGHMWGLEHNFNWLSLMNYLPNAYRAYGLPFSDDAEAMRTAHPPQAVARNDLGVYLFWWDDFMDTVRQTTFPASVVAGDFMSVNTFHVENAGTTTITNPVLRWYLTSLRSYSGSTTFLGSTTFFVELPRFYHLNPGSANAFLSVPEYMNGGLYYLNALSDIAGGASQGGFPYAHNAGWSRTRIRVYPAMAGLDGGWHTGGTSGDAVLYLIGLTDITGLDVTLESADPSIVSVPPNLHVGPYVRQASILVTAADVAARREVTLTARSQGKSVAGVVVVLPATTAVMKDKTGPLAELVALKATFRQKLGGAPLAGVPVTFRIDGDPVEYSSITSSTGVATLKYKPAVALGVGTRTVTARFAGSFDHAAAAVTAALTLTPAKVKLTVTNASGLPGTAVNVSANLKRPGDKTPLAGMSLTFAALGASYTGITNAAGTATVSVSIPLTTAPGQYPVSVSFAGDAIHQARSATGTITVQ